MNFDYKIFFDKIRTSLYNGKLSQAQVNNIPLIIQKFNPTIDFRPCAYALATVYWETDRTMSPIREYGRGKGKAYGVKNKVTGQAYYGRGLVQLTWLDNYAVMGRTVNKDLVNNPDLALDLQTSIDILYEGMTRGMFTGVGLSKYFNNTIGGDPYNARRIINGLDHAKDISLIYEKFLDALTASVTADIVSTTIPNEPIKAPSEPELLPKVQSSSYSELAILGGGIAMVVGAIVYHLLTRS